MAGLIGYQPIHPHVIYRQAGATVAAPVVTLLHSIPQILERLQVRTFDLRTTRIWHTALLEVFAQQL